MEISKIEAKKEALDAYARVIAYAYTEQQREIHFVRVNHGQIDKADIERAQIRAAAFCDIACILERAAVK